MNNANKNAGKYNKQRRHPIVLKKFATLLLINCGSMSYEFLHSNMPEALPSLRSIQNIIHSDYESFREGIFRFDELIQHLSKHEAPFLVTVAEDATRIIKTVEYDSASNTCVGFVLPTNSNGMPITNSFSVNTFADIENYFLNTTKSKYAYVYTVQSLQDGIPSFCLGCIGTDNKFTANDILKRWRYINAQLSLRGIRIINFASDGDSRLLKSMQITSRFTSNDASLSLNIGNAAFQTPLLNKWLCTKLYSLFCVQDMIHIGTKMRNRLLKPSIVLPMGQFIASNAHIHILVRLYGKERHGIREKDLDHRDKQNYVSVENLMRASHLLTKIPDALATKCYIDLINAAVNSFLDKSYPPEKRLHEIWYALFFLRYWRQWLMQHSTFTLKDNFITRNCYVCIEINAHSLLSYVIVIRNLNLHHCFTPWNLGSQSCERLFRSLRSLCSTFSTIVNFSLLAMLQRLHKIAIKEDLESLAEKESHEINCGRDKIHKRKSGHGTMEQFTLADLNDQKIHDILQGAQERAKIDVTTLGMADDLKQMNKFDTPPIPASLQCLVEEEDNDDNVDEEDEIFNELEKEIESNEQCQKIESTFNEDITKLQSINVIDSEVVKHAKLKAKRIANSSVGIPVYRSNEGTEGSLFVKVESHGKEVLIRKRTAVWLFNDTEHVSSDRLFRVRANFNENGTNKHSDSVIMKENTKTPVVSEYIVVGDVCVFICDGMPKVGKVLQFTKYDTKGKKISYKCQYAMVSDRFGVLCTWYTIDKKQVCVMEQTSKEYTPIDTYIGTLTFDCLDFKTEQKDKQLGFTPTLISLPAKFCITLECFEFIQSTISSSANKSSSPSSLVPPAASSLTTPISTSTPPTCTSNSTTPIFIEDDVHTHRSANHWLTIGKLLLTEKHKSIILNGKQITDIQVQAALILLHSQFPDLNGLYNPCYQLSKRPKNVERFLQIIHVTANHWAVISTCKALPHTNGSICIEYYDSIYSKLPETSEDIISFIFSKREFNRVTVECIPIPKQSGATDCGLFAIAVATAIAHEVDAECLVFRQDEMRPHFVQCLENRKMELFPIISKCRLTKPPYTTTIFFCPVCHKADDGNSMVQCEACDDWFHKDCVPPYDDKDSWYCKSCQLNYSN